MSEEYIDITLLEKEYEKKFGKEPPMLPMMISRSIPWYTMMIQAAIDSGKPLPDDIWNTIIEGADVQYDVVEEKEE